MEGRSGRATGSEEGRALRGARQGVGQNSVNKVEGRTDRVTPEQSSVEGRAELRARADNSVFFITFIHFSSILFCMKLVFRLGRRNRKSVRAAPQWMGAASQNGTQSICKNIPCLEQVGSLKQ